MYFIYLNMYNVADKDLHIILFEKNINILNTFIAIKYYIINVTKT